MFASGLHLIQNDHRFNLDIATVCTLVMQVSSMSGGGDFSSIIWINHSNGRIPLNTKTI